MSKGANSILFDFDSIVDIEISIIKYLRGEYRESSSLDTLFGNNKHDFLYSDDTSLQFHRMYGKEDLFRHYLEKDKDNWCNIFESIFDRDQDIILSKKYAHLTSMKFLLTAYKKAGNGIIKTCIRCDNDTQKNLINYFFEDTLVEVCPRDKVDMSKYGRLVVGNYKNAMKYNIEEPKSILLLNFRENFNSKDITILNPELVISLGDINDIQVISAYREDPNIKG